ncbi:45333_t:CDS:2, partial [Gigaspora margarita]
MLLILHAKHSILEEEEKPQLQHALDIFFDTSVMEVVDNLKTVQINYQRPWLCYNYWKPGHIARERIEHIKEKSKIGDGTIEKMARINGKFVKASIRLNDKVVGCAHSIEIVVDSVKVVQEFCKDRKCYCMIRSDNYESMFVIAEEPAIDKNVVNKNYIIKENNSRRKSNIANVRYILDTKRNNNVNIRLLKDKKKSIQIKVMNSESLP